MAVWVLLAFNDEEQAKNYVEANIPSYTFDSDLVEYLIVGATVHGVWKKPTVFCDPSDGHRGKKTDSGWTRGKKYGWWVCGRCGKPSEVKQGSTEWALALGSNLLPPELTPGQYRLKGWESPMEWKFLLPKEQTVDSTNDSTI